jgi:DNA repair protein RecN (Recombination protein N)
MLSKLRIENYALIDQLEIDFTSGFSVITGETGAGKSILVGAISLLLGQRSDSSVLLDKSRKCIVEGIFNTENYQLEDFFSENSLDQEETTILRREITQSGKSRTFINDTPVTLGVLKSLGDRLVNIHSQHSIVTLHDADFQLAIIDSFAGNRPHLEKYREQYSRYRKVSAELDDLITKEGSLRKERDYHSFLFHELENAHLREGEQLAAEERLKMLSHAEEIKSQLQKASGMVSENESAILNQLAEIISSLQHIAEFHPIFNELVTRINTDFIDLKDISHEILRLEDEVQYDPGEAGKISDRLDVIYNLEKKHGVSTVEDLIRIQEEIGHHLQEEGSLDERISELTATLQTMRDTLFKSAADISGRRKKVCGEMEDRITGTLKMLGIPDARFIIERTSGTELKSDGIDQVKFLFSANKGIGPDEISRIASGGEQSRLMLSIKSMISEKNLLPTVIFDEIDNGVSGIVAGKVAAILRSMGKIMQVIAISHLPQIAGQGEMHYGVYKTTVQGAAKTQIRKLNKEERVHEIAKMLSNKNITASAMKTAQELLKN